MRRLYFIIILLNIVVPHLLIYFLYKLPELSYYFYSRYNILQCLASSSYMYYYTKYIAAIINVIIFFIAIHTNSQKSSVAEVKRRAFFTEKIFKQLAIILLIMGFYPYLYLLLQCILFVFSSRHY
jgi:hypothetical protein